MKNKKLNKIFPYSGNKLWLFDKINEKIKEEFGENQVLLFDLFCGSGAIAYNCPNAKSVLINDLDDAIINMHRAVNSKVFSYEDYLKTLEEIESNFGDISKDKEAYYNYRNHWNENFYKDGHISSSDYTGLKLLPLAGACLNSMLRFSKNGMNQSFGKRKYVIPKETWDNIQLGNYYCCNCDFFKNFKYFEKIANTHIDEHKNLKQVVFLDPPYVFREMTYNKGFSSLERFIEIIKSEVFFPEALILYTDTDNEISNTLLKDSNWSSEWIRDMKSTSPNRKNENITAKEMLFQRKPLGER